MTDDKRIEVTLEICSGFFRIPTDAIVYNITVLPAGESSATKVVERIIEVEKVVEMAGKAPSGPPPVAVPPGDDYFERCLRYLAQELALAAPAPPSGALTALAGEFDQALAAVRQAADSLSGPGPTALAALAALEERLALASARQAAPAGPPPVTKTVTRYLFNLDAVFQTMYELCTNETVKGHIQDARARAGEIFDLNRFHDLISPQAAGYREDDGFLAAPMSDIYAALGTVCSDKGIRNLLAKMDKQKDTIFLDQFLPLEVPAKEEVSVPDPEAQAGAAPGEDGAGMLADCRTGVESLRLALTAGGADAPLAERLGEVLKLGGSLKGEVARLAGMLAGSVPEAYLAPRMAAQARELLALKEKTPGLAFADGLAAVSKGAGVRVKDDPPPAGAEAKPSPAVSLGQEDFGEASQDDIDRLLEELS